MSETEDISSVFNEKGYVAIPGFLPGGLARLVYDYTNIRFANGDLEVIDDGFVPMALTKYGDYFCESLLIHYLPVMKQLTGKDLAPTYSYLRRYKADTAVSIALRHVLVMIMMVMIFNGQSI